MNQITNTINIERNRTNTPYYKYLTLLSDTPIGIIIGSIITGLLFWLGIVTHTPIYSILLLIIMIFGVTALEDYLKKISHWD